MFETLLEYLSNYFIPKDAPKTPLFSKFSQIESLMKTNSKKTFSFFYSNRKDIHQLLYDNDQMIKLDSNIANERLSNLFYIILLIKEQVDLVNYFYDISFIQNANNKRKKTKNSLTNFIFAMIIIELISNYKASETYDEDNYSDNEILEQIEEENIRIRDCAIAELKEMNLNVSEEYIEENMINEIYVEIINSLIDEKKLDDFEYCSNILEQIGLDEIELTENMYNALLRTFNNNEEYTSQFQFSQLDDLFNEKIMNFYMTIFKYILKDSLYIYNFSFLQKARNDFLKIIKSDSDYKLSKFIDDSNNRNPNFQNKVSYIVKKFCDSEYYISNYLNHTKKEIMEIIQYYKNFFFIEKEEVIIKLEKYLNNKYNLKENDLEEYLKDFNKAKELNERKDIIYFLYEGKNKKNVEKNEKTQKELEKYIKKMKDCEKMIKDGKFKRKMRNDDKVLFYKYFNNEDNHKISLNIFSEDQINSFMNKIENEKEIIGLKNKENNLSKNIAEFEPNQDKIPTEDTEKKVENIENIKIIGTHQNKAESIIKTKNEEYISMGESSLFLYDESFSKISEIKNSNIYTGLNEFEKEDKETEIIATTTKEFSIITVDDRKLKSRNEAGNIPSLTKKSCLPIDSRNHIVFCKEGVLHIKDLFSQILSFNANIITKDNCIGGIRISKDLIAITSNKKIERGKDSIKFYNHTLGKIIKEIDYEYSFSNSINGLRVLNSEERNKNVLLCACKKNGTKNGILLINTDKIQNSDNIEEYLEFYETGNFEVSAFCPLFGYGNIKTDYFLVGGFNKIKDKGEIKLYKYEKKANEIKFVSNLDIDKNSNEFKGFNGAINCMIQTNDEKILATCSDGNVYLFSEPNLDFDEKLKNQKNKEVFLKVMKN